jgi:hypothetical protein
MGARAAGFPALALMLALAPAAVAQDRARCATPTITYRLETVGGAASLAARFDASQRDLLQKLNRVDGDSLARLDQMVVPDRWLDDDLAYSPLPRFYGWGDRPSKLLVVFQPAQVFGAYEYGRLVRWGPVSSGRQTAQTPTGLFHLNWRSKGRHSTIDPDWFMAWYFNFHNAEGLSLHEYALPGRPASHACVRLRRADAIWLYDWGEQWQLDAARRRVLADGTPVLIIGTYDFGAPAPWRSTAFPARRVKLPDDPPTAFHQP